MDALRITGLTKAFDKPAVRGLDLALRQGEFYALLGPTAPARPPACA